MSKTRVDHDVKVLSLLRTVADKVARSYEPLVKGEFVESVPFPGLVPGLSLCDVPLNDLVRDLYLQGAGTREDILAAWDAVPGSNLTKIRARFKGVFPNIPFQSPHADLGVVLAQFLFVSSWVFGKMRHGRTADIWSLTDREFEIAMKPGRIKVSTSKAYQPLGISLGFAPIEIKRVTQGGFSTIGVRSAAVRKYLKSQLYRQDEEVDALFFIVANGEADIERHLHRLYGVQRPKTEVYKKKPLPKPPKPPKVPEPIDPNLPPIPPRVDRRTHRDDQPVPISDFADEFLTAKVEVIEATRCPLKLLHEILCPILGADKFRESFGDVTRNAGRFTEEKQRHYLKVIELYMAGKYHLPTPYMLKEREAEKLLQLQNSIRGIR